MSLYFRPIRFCHWLWHRPTRQLQDLLTEMQDLRTALETAARSTSHLRDIVAFSAAVAIWHDQEERIEKLRRRLDECNFWDQYDAALRDLEQLAVHCRQAGRSDFDYNRTRPGQPVTADKVYLGNIWGLFTHSVAFWIERLDPNEPRTIRDHPLVGATAMPVNTWDLISGQARRIMEHHSKHMLVILERLRQHATA